MILLFEYKFDISVKINVGFTQMFWFQMQYIETRGTIRDKRGYILDI